MNVKNLYEGRNTRNTDLSPFTDINDSRLVWLENDFLQYFDAWKRAVTSRPGNFSIKLRQQMQLSCQTLSGLRLTSLSVVAIVKSYWSRGTFCFNKSFESRSVRATIWTFSTQGRGQ
jgi:hypothetical protein